ncbi:MAG: glycogen/starch/alpha-glucan phosphorylase, partial [Candidatus Sericytochromatia bacterium]|nr:glycogen/starch/alpha-glucan phosphorylase [Candidatus Sericytochromatia bacterium]
MTTKKSDENKVITEKEIKENFLEHLESGFAKELDNATKLDVYDSFVYTTRDLLIKRWIKTKKEYLSKNAKTVNYISMEFLMGRALVNSLLNLGIYDESSKGLMELGVNLEELEEIELDAGLGNGGLGRLAACFLDSLTTLKYPAFGYGIRYEYGIFQQKIQDGYQIELPDNWLRYGNSWEIPRPEMIYLIPFYGDVKIYLDKKGKHVYQWQPSQTVMAMAYDYMIPGYKNDNVNTLRLWGAKSTRDFDFDDFNKGDYIGAIEQKAETENISKVLYPNDMFNKGKELRLKQEFFFSSATLQDIIRRYHMYNSDNFNNFATQNAIQLNDTHPAVAIPELMRLLMDVEGLSWEKSWDITTKVFSYTNHTVMPEALEKWSTELFSYVLPRHMQIIFEIERRFLKYVESKYPDDQAKLDRMSIVKDGTVRMANLAIIGSHTINGVAKLHTEIVKHDIFKDFYELNPEKFQNKTNGITQRRWLLKCNPGLSNLITETIGDKWITDLYELKKLEPFAEDAKFRKKWKHIKKINKQRLAECIKKELNTDINIDSIIDCQIKRIHEYKRQLMNVMHIIHFYLEIKDNPNKKVVPRTFVLSGKAAPAYFIAKLIIKLANSVAEIVNKDADIGDKIKVVFLPNYRVSLAEIIIPAADLSEQISTAGMEASGTGNMKFALNGALTIGTLDGANIEIKEEVGDDNIFIFGLTDEEIKAKKSTYKPMDVFNQEREVNRVINLIAEGFFSRNEPGLFKPLIDSLLYQGDN